MARSSMSPLGPSNTSSTLRAPAKAHRFGANAKSAESVADAAEGASQAPAHATRRHPGRRASGVVHAPRTKGRFASHTTPFERVTPAKGPAGARWARAGVRDDRGVTGSVLDRSVEGSPSSSETRRARSVAAADAADADADAADADAAADAAATVAGSTPRDESRDCRISARTIFSASEAASVAASAARAAAAATAAAPPSRRFVGVCPYAREAAETSGVVSRRAKCSRSVFARRAGWNGRVATYTARTSAGA